MTPRLVGGVAGVAALLALAGIASHGRPLSGAAAGSGPTATFFDYVATSLVIAAIVLLGVLVFVLFSGRRGGKPDRRGRWHLLGTLLTMAAAALLAWLVVHSSFEQRLKRAAEQAAQREQQPQAQPRRPPAGKNARNPHLRWDEIAIVVALLGGTAVVLYARRRTKAAPRPLRRLRRGEAVSLALDESLDDLRNDPDLRRAIVAAYARMERALASVGLPRRPSEAPFEYVERALRSLETSADAAERLTTLFEWAKFSQHEPGPEMRDDAIDALVAVRDELRRETAAVA